MSLSSKISTPDLKESEQKSEEFNYDVYVKKKIALFSKYYKYNEDVYRVMLNESKITSSFYVEK